MLLPVIVYYAVPCFVLRCFGVTDFIGGGQQAVFFLSKSPYWFIKAYFGLFLIAPVLNHYLDSAITKEKLYLLLSLMFVSVWSSIMGDSAYLDGKNIAMFMTLYVLGDILKEIQPKINRIPNWLFLIVWLFLNVILIILFILYNGSTIGDTVWSLSFPYSSPVLIVNATLFFILFSRLTIKAPLINIVASSVFAVYILTEHSLIKPLLLMPVLNTIYDGSSGSIEIIVYTMLFALCVMTSAVILDKIFQPFFKICISRIDKIGNSNI